MDLDDLLAAAAPPTSAPTREREAALADLVTATRARRPRRRRAVAVGVVIAAVIGGTAATTAAVAPDGWIPWTGSHGQTCEWKVMVGPADRDNGEPNMEPHPIDPQRQARLVADAQAFLDHFDYAAIDQQRATAAFEAQQRRIGAKGSDPDTETGDDRDQSAITTWVLGKMDAHLAAQGWDMSKHKGSDAFLLISMAEWDCQ
jgi:hypothetical protein